MSFCAVTLFRLIDSLIRNTDVTVRLIKCRKRGENIRYVFFYTLYGFTKVFEETIDLFVKFLEIFFHYMHRCKLTLDRILILCL